MSSINLTTIRVIYFTKSIGFLLNIWRCTHEMLFVPPLVRYIFSFSFILFRFGFFLLCEFYFVVHFQFTYNAWHSILYVWLACYSTIKYTPKCSENWWGYWEKYLRNNYMREKCQSWKNIFLCICLWKEWEHNIRYFEHRSPVESAVLLVCTHVSVCSVCTFLFFIFFCRCSVFFLILNLSRREHPPTYYTIILLIRVYAFTMVIQKAFYIFSTPCTAFFPTRAIRLYACWFGWFLYFFHQAVYCKKMPRRMYIYTYISIFIHIKWKESECLYRKHKTRLFSRAQYAHIPFNEYTKLRRWKERMAKEKKHTPHTYISISIYIYT